MNKEKKISASVAGRRRSGSGRSLYDVKNLPLLTADQEIELGRRVQSMIEVATRNGLDWTKVRACDIKKLMDAVSHEDREVIRLGLRARDKMVSHNMRLAIDIAGNMLKNNQWSTGFTVMDLSQEGMIGLQRAAELFDPSRGYRFSTYSYMWIKQAMQRAIERTGSVMSIPSSLRRDMQQVARLFAVFYAKNGRNPSVEEAIHITGKSKARLLDIARAAVLSKISSLDKDLFVESAGSLERWHEDHQEAQGAGEVDCEVGELPSNVIQLISLLPPNEEKLLKEYYGVDTGIVEHRELAERSGLTLENMKALIGGILAKLKFVASVQQ